MKTHDDVIKLLDKFSVVNNLLYYAYFPVNFAKPNYGNNTYHCIFKQGFPQTAYKDIRSKNIYRLYSLLHDVAMEEISERILFYKDQEAVYGKKYSSMKAQLNDITIEYLNGGADDDF